MTKFLLIPILLVGINILIISILKYNYSINIIKEYRYKHINHIKVLILEIILFTIFYIFINEFTYFILALMITSYLIFKLLYKINFEKDLNNNKLTNEEVPIYYYISNNKYYIKEKYLNLSNPFKLTSIASIITLNIITILLYFTDKIDFNNIMILTASFIFLSILLLEISYYLSGSLEEKTIIIHKENDKKNTIKDIIFTKINDEYNKLWPNHLAKTYIIKDNYKKEIIDTNYDDLSLIIANATTDDEINSYVYSRIINNIINEENIIIESNLLEYFSPVIIPVINLLFASNKKMMFICDNYETVNNCNKWLSVLNINSTNNNSNIVINVLDYNNNLNIDNNIDIYISTPSIALNNKHICKDIDIIFGINIDKIILNDTLNLNILASIFNENSKYILFTNRLNDINQAISKIFMKNNFKYHVIEKNISNNIITNFFKSEVGWLQLNVLPNFANQYLGNLIPIALPCFKYNNKTINIISPNSPYHDQLISLQKSKNILRNYLEKDIVNINELINISSNENFLKINENLVLIVEDDINNVALILLNYLKYNKKELLLNIVSNPYLLRDYIIDNIEFFIGNAEMLSNILSVPKSNVKLKIYKLINRLCSSTIEEEILLRELNIDTKNNDQYYSISNTLNLLTKEAFNIDIYYSTYLTYQNIDNKNYYKLLDIIKNELPDKIFKTIKFIDSEQNDKILNKIPVFDLYQNYLEGQYTTINGKYYLIDKIDYNNNSVELMPSSNNNNYHYRQHKEITNIINNYIVKDYQSNKIRNTILEKKIINSNITINTLGYYEFNNNISFLTGEYSYKKVNITRNYKSTDILNIKITSKDILSMNDKDLFKVSFTISILLNEIFNTLFSNVNKYIITRSVVKNKTIYSDHKNNELINMYKPIIYENIDEGINIYITEDTELEKGIIESIINNFDNTILKILYDYLHWLLKEDNNNKNDKLSFLRYGKKQLSKCIDLENAYKVIHNLLLVGNDNITNSRVEYMNKINEPEN